VSNKYDSYKDSGIEWIGEIPLGWELMTVRRITQDHKQGYYSPEGYKEDGHKLVRITDLDANGNIDTSTSPFVSPTEKELEVFEIKKGDILFPRTGSVGLVGVAKNDMKAVFASYLIRFRFSDKTENSFMRYYFISEAFLNGLFSDLHGGVNQNIHAENIKDQWISLPSLLEQTTIATYLDQKTTQIDDLIAKKERLIQLLEEERTAIINQAVTKGLDPTVPMKDSGIEWLGEIPEHWELWKISHAFKRIGSGTTPESGNPTYHENGTINWLNTGDLNDGEVASCNKRITEQAMIDYTSLKLFPAGSLIMAMYGATIGKTGIIKFETTTNQACCVFCEGEIIDLKFLQYWFLAKKENIINLAIGGGQPNISQNILKDIRVNCPEISEQIRIVQYLDSSTKEVDLVISKTNEEIELLKEYKTALISEVVTGKVDVRYEKI
jgi:type I restriction enzyme, S subunit